MGLVLVSLVLVYIWVRPSYVDPKVPGPKRHLLLGVTFGEASEILEDGFGYDKWPTLSILLSRRFDFQTWGGPTINFGFGGAFFKNWLGKRTRQDAAREFKQRFVIGNQEKSSIVVV